MLTNKLKFVLVLLFMALITSCTKDDGDAKISNNVSQEKRFNRISLNEFASKVSINNYNRLSNYFVSNSPTNTSNERLEITDEPWLMTDEIVMIQRDSITFYTFKISVNLIQNEFYNLIVQIDDTQTILSTRIIEYTPSENWLEDPTQTFSGHMKLVDNDFFSIEDISNTLSLRQNNTCIVSYDWAWECQDGYPHAPGTCNKGPSELIVIPVYGECPPIIDPGDSTGGIPVNPNDTGGTDGGGTSDGGNEDNGGSENDNPPDDGEDCVLDSDGNCLSDETTPMPVLNKADKKNCEELQDDIQEPENPISAPQKSIRDALMDLKNQITENVDVTQGERGYHMITGAASEKKANPIPYAGTLNEIAYKTYANIFGGAHLHAKNGRAFPMFSFGDVIDLLAWSNNYNPNETDTQPILVHYLVTYKGVYAIKIENLGILQQLQTILDDKDDANQDGIDLIVTYNDEIKKKYARHQDSMDEPNGSPSEYEREFLKFLENFDDNGNGLGISLFKADNSLTSWEKLTLNDDDSIGKTPCIN